MSLAIRPSFEAKGVIDSSSYPFYPIQVADSNAILIRSFIFKLPVLITSVLEIKLEDINRKTKAETYITLDKSKQSPQQFLVKIAGTDYPAFKNYFSSNEKVNVIPNDNSKPVMVRVFWKQ